MQVVRTVVQSKLIVLTVQRELTLADAVAPTANQCREVRLVAAGELLDAVVTLNNVCYFAIFIGNHDSTYCATIIRDSYFITLTVLQNVKIRLFSIHRGLEILAVQTTQIRCFVCVCHIVNVLSYLIYFAK